MISSGLEGCSIPYYYASSSKRFDLMGQPIIFGVKITTTRRESCAVCVYYVRRTEKVEYILRGDNLLRTSCTKSTLL